MQIETIERGFLAKLGCDTFYGLIVSKWALQSYFSSLRVSNDDKLQYRSWHNIGM